MLRSQEDRGARVFSQRWSETRSLVARASLLFLVYLVLCAGNAVAAQEPRTRPKLTNEECLVCHGDVTLSKDANGKPGLEINQERFEKSIHSMFNCVDCHTDVKTSPHENVPVKLSCGQCHADQQATYDRSLHAQSQKAGNAQAATCIDCHGNPHEVLPASDPTSRVNRANIPSTCGTCHGQKFVMSASGLSTQVFVSYEQSVHGRAVSAGSQKAAVCTDCHGAHEILMGGDPKSSTFKFNVPATCGKCHVQQAQQYLESIHGQAIRRGNWLAPVCSDCHGIHTIQAPDNPSSSVSAQALAQITCARCHQGVQLTKEFGVPGSRVSGYQASYHGLAARLGSTVVANCASCHGAHSILPSSDPRSAINQANLAVTCGQCHPGATTKFTRFPVHAEASAAADIGSVMVAWVKRFYLGVILLVVGAMILHNLVVWRSKAVARRELEHATIVRMTLNQRIQHWILFGCFAVLVLTGFALIYPFSTVADMIGITDPIRRVVHRIAGITLIAIGIYHVFYVFVSRSGHRMVLALLPETKDARDLLKTLRYHLGLSPDKPQFGRFNYGEKFEYWALVWGTVIMASTGLMAWFQVMVTRFLPGWWIDVALTIHLYEAILATLAILVWHLYQVMFDPDVFPLNWSWWDGRMSFVHYREEHALDTETLLGAVEDGRSAEPIADASKPPTGKRHSITWTPVLSRPAWLIAGTFVLILLVAAGWLIRGRWFRPPDTHLLSITGEISDSQCGASHKPALETPECVRSCVKRGAKYVLNDGTHSFVLADQQAAEGFAAQKVVATGLVDEMTGDLQLRSIRAVAR